MPDGDSPAGLTPLSWTAEEEYDAVTKLLLEKGADANSEDNWSDATVVGRERRV